MSKTTTAQQAIAQIIKMSDSVAKLEDRKKPERGAEWRKNTDFNNGIQAKINAINEKITHYSQFISEADYDASELSCMMCCTYQDFIG